MADNWLVGLCVLLLILVIILSSLLCYGIIIFEHLNGFQSALENAWSMVDYENQETGLVNGKVSVYPWDPQGSETYNHALYISLMIQRIDIHAKLAFMGVQRPINHLPELEVISELVAVESNTLSEPTFGVIYKSRLYPHVVFIVMRGTSTVAEAAQDLQMKQTSFGTYGNIHAGFYSLYSSYEGQIARIIEEQQRERALTLFIGGYSLGGAVSTCVALDMAHRFPTINIYSYSIAAPRIGDETFAETLAQTTNLKHWRIFNETDMIPDLPPTIMPNFHSSKPLVYVYQHVGEALSFHTNYGSWQMNHDLDIHVSFLRQAV